MSADQPDPRCLPLPIPGGSVECVAEGVIAADLEGGRAVQFERPARCSSPTTCRAISVRIGAAAGEAFSNSHGGAEQVTNVTEHVRRKFVRRAVGARVGMSTACGDHDVIRMDFDRDGESAHALLGSYAARNGATSARETGEHPSSRRTRVQGSEQTITPIRDSAGRVSRFVSVGKDLTEVRASIERSSKLDLARLVQQRMYPDSPPGDCGFDVAGTAIPADETGGDYYDYLQLPGGGLALAVGDVSGHGFDAALHMVQARTMLRAVIQTQRSPGDVLSQMNSLLLDELEEHRFITLVLACLHPDPARCATQAPATRRATCSGRADASKPTSSTGVPLGLIGGAVRIGRGRGLEEAHRRAVHGRDRRERRRDAFGRGRPAAQAPSSRSAATSSARVPGRAGVRPGPADRRHDHGGMQGRRFSR